MSEISGFAALRTYPLLDAMRNRRSRRFSMGAEMPGGGLAYKSTRAPMPLATLEEALLVFAASGLTGFCLGDLPYQSDAPESAGGNVMAGFRGRAIPSADAVHATSLFVTNDEGTYLIPRPQDLSLSDFTTLSAMGTEQRVEEFYRTARVKLKDGRTEIPRDVPSMFPFNRWSTNLPGTTYFIPISDLTAMYLNVLFSAFDEQMALFALDERKGLRPAGVAKFAKSKGGRLHDDPASGRVVTVLMLESYILEFVMAEQAFMGQQMMLLEQAMGLGGWSHFSSANPNAWFEALGFEMSSQPLSRSMGAGCFKTWFMNLMGKNSPVPFPLGLSGHGREILKPYCPPYFDSMDAAVYGFLDVKLKAIKSHIPDSPSARWADEAAIKASIPEFSQPCIDAVLAYCRYVFETYGRFPAHFGPCRTTFAHQAHHLDLDFYDKFYNPDAYTETQRDHVAKWHGRT